MKYSRLVLIFTLVAAFAVLILIPPASVQADCTGSAGVDTVSPDIVGTIGADTINCVNQTITNGGSGVAIDARENNDLVGIDHSSVTASASGNGITLGTGNDTLTVEGASTITSTNADG